MDFIHELFYGLKYPHLTFLLSGPVWVPEALSLSLSLSLISLFYNTMLIIKNSMFKVYTCILYWLLFITLIINTYNYYCCSYSAIVICIFYFFKPNPLSPKHRGPKLINQSYINCSAPILRTATLRRRTYAGEYTLTYIR